METILHHVPRPVELLIVDDDSPDQTWNIAQELEKRFKEVRLIRRRGKRSLPASLNEGVADAKGEKILWMDADFSMPPEVIPKLVSSLEIYPIVIGSRYVPGGKDSRGSFLPVFLSRLFNSLATILLGEVRDYTSGFVAARKEVLERIGLSGRYGEYCVRFLYRAKEAGYRIKEVPYECQPRRRGRTKTFSSPWQLIKYGKDYLWTLLSLRIGHP